MTTISDGSENADPEAGTDAAPVPVTRESVVGLVIATLAPMVPLLLTMMPLKELVRTLFALLA